MAFDDFESWEVEYELKQAEDWPGLIRYLQNYVRRYPHDLYAKIRLGEAYILNGECQKAIDYLAEIHRQNPDIGDIKHYILEALFALGKTEDDFEWVEKPVITRLNEDLLDRCYQYLRLKRKPRWISEIVWGIASGEYQTFEQEALFEALKADGRFEVQGDEISVRRKR